MPHGVMNTGSLPAVFIMRSHVCVKRPVRSQNRLAKPVPLISHPINRMWSRSLFMLADISNVDAIYIVCGRTDMRKSIDGLCAIIQDQFSMEIDHALYLFCGRKCDRIKAILKEPDGIVMIYKRLTAQGSYRWPRDKSEVRNLTWREFDWLMSGIDIEQPKAIRTSCARQ